MAEPSGITRINSFFDAFDDAIDKVGTALHRGEHTAERVKSRGGVVKKPSPSSTSTSTSTSTAIASRRPFRVIESVDAETGEAMFVVTDGALRAECTTRAFAEMIIRALEASP